MKFVVVSALFTAAIALFGAPSSAPQAAAQPAISEPAVEASVMSDEDNGTDVGTECEVAGGVCRKSACRGGETSVPLECGHDLGCCLAR